MRNLVCTQKDEVNLESLQAPGLPLTAVTWDLVTQSRICVFGPSPTQSSIEIDILHQNGILEPITSWDLAANPTEKVLDVHHCAEVAIIYVILASGDIVAVRVSGDGGEATVDVVGSVEGGILATTWSPDEEIIAILCHNQKLLFMTTSMHTLADVELTEADMQLSQHVDVGWGKAETQFKGKRMASLQDPTLKTSTTKGLLSDHDNGQAQISWRGDSAYVAVSTVEQNNRRAIRVFTRDGVLESVSEPVDYLEGPMAWKPSGNVIAGYTRTHEALEVVFFERNGLRHGEFSLRVPLAQVATSQIFSMRWSADSTVLAVHMCGKIQLWSMGNYHWYLKRDISTDISVDSCIFWHPEKSLQLLYHEPSSCNIYDFVWDMHRDSSGGSSLDRGMVAVTDGNMLKYTPLGIVQIPPPYALHDIELPYNIVDVSISTDSALIAVLANNKVIFLTNNTGKGAVYEPPKLLSHEIELESTIKGSTRQISFLENSSLVVLSDVGSHSKIALFDKNQDDSWICSWSSSCDKVMRLIGHTLTPCCELYDGQIVVFNHQSSQHGELSLRFAQPCPWVERCPVNDGDDIFIGLTRNGRLLVNETELAQSCTSFCVTRTHLVFTTTSNLLKFVKLSENITDWQIPGDEMSGHDTCRAIERGAKLVCVIPTTFAVVLQMPRGNLETIYPRVLVLAGITSNIDTLDYRQAFKICRTHRVDMNILHSYKPEQFLASIMEFVDQIANPQFIDLFLSNLSTFSSQDKNDHLGHDKEVPPNVTSHKQLNSFGTDSNTKINAICDAVIGAISGGTKNIQNLITAHVSKQPPDLDSALILIANLNDQGLAVVEQAIEHICFLCDVNKLYNQALGLYNLDLALLIAQQSQKDPREYLPFVQSIQSMQHKRQRFFLDNHLHNYVRAASWLYEMGMDAFTELCNYTVKHELYISVLSLCQYDESNYKTVLTLYAQFLDTKARYLDAGIAFEYLGLYQRATESYQRGGYWQQAMFSATSVPVSEEEIHELALVLAENLVESKNYRDAAKLYLEYRNDLQESLKTLCKGFEFDEALRLAALKRQLELANTIVDPGLVDGFNVISEFLADCKEQVNAQMKRIRELREKKQSDPLSYYNGAVEEDAPDNISIAPSTQTTSNGTNYTRYTDKTGDTLNTMTTRKTKKNTRREERKKARGKKGSAYEEDYLVASIGRLVERLASHQADIDQLIRNLVRRGMREQSRAIQTASIVLADLLDTILPEVIEPTDGADSGIPAKDNDLFKHNLVSSLTTFRSVAIR